MAAQGSSSTMAQVFHPQSTPSPLDSNDSGFSIRGKLHFLVPMAVIFVFANLFFYRLLIVLNRTNPAKLSPRPKPSRDHPTHLLVVLGSGGHTTEMLNMLSRLPSLATQYTHRTYIVSSGDGFSAAKAAEFEGSLADALPASYGIATVRRARRVHQSLVTAPWSTLRCIYDCIRVLHRGAQPAPPPSPSHHSQQKQQRPLSPPSTPQSTSHNTYPDLILTNGPGTGVCVVLAAIMLLFCGFGGPHATKASPHSTTDGLPSPPPPPPSPPYQASGQMRTIFIESWARVQSLSLSGTILLPFANRFLVQWPALAVPGSGAEYTGFLIP